VRERDYIELGWLAGIIDGEGCISAYVSRGKVKCSVVIETVSPNMEKHIRKIYNKHDIWHTEDVAYHKNSVRPALRVRVAKKLGVIKLLKLLLPHLVNKKREAKALIEWYENEDHRDTSIVERLKRLKRIA